VGGNPAVVPAVDRAPETSSKVAELAAAADRIGEVVRLISSIAGQTNLLARDRRKICNFNRLQAMWPSLLCFSYARW
jgi:hypothetical protein